MTRSTFLLAATMVFWLASELSAQDTSPGEYFDGTVSLLLIAPSEVRQDAAIEGLDIALVNNGSVPFRFFYGGDLMNFELTDENGEVIGRHFTGIVPSFLGVRSVAPRSTLLLASVTGRGDPRLAEELGLRLGLGPEVRSLRGVVRLSAGPSGMPDEFVRLETAVQTVRVLPPR